VPTAHIDKLKATEQVQRIEARRAKVLDVAAPRTSIAPSTSSFPIESWFTGGNGLVEGDLVLAIPRLLGVIFFFWQLSWIILPPTYLEFRATWFERP
jgi:hypothetical protein